MHKPVLTEEVIRHLNLKKGGAYLDATVGCGGHAALILEEISPEGFLIGIDCDEEALTYARSKLSKFKESSYKIIKANFRNADSILEDIGIKKIDGALFDLGVSLLQFKNADRGFSINLDGALDMRMDLSQGLNAFDIVNKYPENQLYRIIREFGEERYAGRIARFISEKRKTSKIRTTSELANVITRAVGYRYRKLKIHPATRTFQAIRITVNKELDALSEALEKLPFILNKGARVCVISFHSLEDRIVKNYFKRYAKENKFLLVNKKPIIASLEEVRQNPRSRSAKMRVAEFK